MSWNNTVTCSECYQTGHNRAGCPRRKERYQEALAKPEEERGYYENSLIREMEAKKNSNTKRRCSYCAESGHNRRKCEPLAEHSEHVQRQQTAFRTAFLEHIREIGLNIGCLFKGTGDYVSKNALGIVIDINWNEVSVTNCSSGIQRFVRARPLSKLTHNRSYDSYSIHRPDHWPIGETFPTKENCWLETSYSGEVVGPSETPIEPPSGWLTDTQPVKEFFKDRALWQWPTENSANNYNSCNWWNLEENQELKKTA